LLEGGLFAPSPKGGLEVDLGKIAAGKVPLTMEDAIRARLEGLDERERAVVERAAVVGESFREGAVLALQRAEDAIEGRLIPIARWIRVIPYTPVMRGIRPPNARPAIP
jgi:hypothetical protein